MKIYKGLYIDNIIFHNEEDIDKHLEKLAIDRHIMLCKFFAERPDFEISIECSKQADLLHNQFGFTWEEIEKMELAAIA